MKSIKTALILMFILACNLALSAAIPAEVNAVAFAELTISGTITSGGSPLAGVVMSGLPGDPVPVTNASGFYTAAVDSGWSGTVTPALMGYIFTPSSNTYENVTTDQINQDFTAVSDGTEPNNDPASAANLPMGTTENLIYTGGDTPDVDWYKFFVPSEAAGQDLKVNVRVTSPYPDPLPPGWRSDLDFELLDGALSVRGVAQSGSDNETLYLHDVTSGWYYINIGYCSTDYADSSDYARYSISLETGTNFGLGYISGRVVDGLGQGIEKVFVSMYFFPFNQMINYPIMTTGPGGFFSLAFSPGTYDLFFTGDELLSLNQPAVNVVNEWYRDKKKRSDADHLSLANGQTLNLGDVTLEIGAIVTGHVTNSSGTTLANVRVYSFDPEGVYWSSAFTDASGNYTLSGIPVGGAKFGFSRIGYASEYYYDRPTLGSADLLPTQSGVTIPNINAQLSPGGNISGTVKDGQGNGLIVNVRLYSVLDETFARTSISSLTGSGSFNFSKIKPGDYKIYFNSAAAGFAPEWYADAASFAQAAVVNVSEGGTTSGIDAQLAALAPEINLKQGTTTIATGGTYGFDSKIINTDTDAIFTIENIGNADLTLSGIPLAISGANTDQFSITVQPTSPVVPAGNTNFTVRFHPTSAGDKTAQISIASNDGDENPYILNLTGTGTVPANTITVTSPNGGESWVVGSTHNITWTTTGISNVKIEYSTNNGTAWTSVTASTPNNGNYDWTVPYASSTQCLVRVSESSTGTPADVSNAVFSIVSIILPPRIALSKTSLNFGTTAGGTSTSSQSVVISNSGEGTLNWMADSSDIWLMASPTAGTGTGTMNVSVNPSGLAEGTHTGAVNITAAGADNSPQVISVTLKVYAAGGTSVPFGSFDTPIHNSTVRGSISVTGWALDDIEVTKVEVRRDPVTGDPPGAIGADGLVWIGDATFVEGARPDVEAAQPSYPLNYRAGWGYMLLTYGLPAQGNGTFVLHAVASDKDGHTTELGTKTIVSDNANNTKPFGAIDTPAQGGTTSGNPYVNFGWVLTPPPAMVPIDGSTIWLWIDGVQVGHPTYNQYRADVHDAYPDYLNADGAVGFYYIDTTAYADGMHTIGWSATDDHSQTEGMGSRFFWVFNGSSGAGAAALDTRNGSLVDLAGIPADVLSPIYLRTGFRDAGPHQVANPDAHGIRSVTIEETDRLVMALDSPEKLPDEGRDLRGKRSSNRDSVELTGAARWTGYLVVGNELRPLPIGSTLDARRGVFYWQPGPGFLGTYRFVFVDGRDGKKKFATLDIRPKSFSKKS